MMSKKPASQSGRALLSVTLFAALCTTGLLASITHMPKRDPTKAQEWVPGVPGSLVSQWEGMHREGNRRNIPLSRFWTLENVALEDGEVQSRLGISKVNTADNAGTNTCEYGITDLNSDPEQLNNYLIIRIISQSKVYVYTPELGLFSSDNSNYTNTKGRRGVHRFNDEVWLFGQKLIVTREDASIRASFGPIEFDHPSGSAFSWVQLFDSRTTELDGETPTRPGLKDLWMLRTGELYRYDGTSVTAENTGLDTADAGIALMPFNDDLLILLTTDGGSNTLTAWDEDAYTSISWPYGDDFLLTDWINYKGTLYMGGYSNTQSTLALLVYSYDGTTVVNETSGGQVGGTPAEANVSFIEGADGDLYYAWNDAVQGATQYIGNYDGVTWTNTFKDMTAVTGDDTECWIRVFRGDVYFISTSGIWRADDPTSLSGTWTQVDSTGFSDDVCDAFVI